MGTEHITYRHFGSKTFHPEYFGKIVNDPSRSKPYGGLWASRVDASHGWEEFCRCAHYQTKSLRKHFDFTLLPDANVYTIHSMKDLTALPMRENPNPAVYGMYLPDFEKCVRLGIDAVELAWYGDEFRQAGSGPVGNALRSWDCDSIVILNPDIILTEEVTKQRKERCLDCAYLVEDENGNWVCDDCGKNVKMIPDHACSAEQDW